MAKLDETLTMLKELTDAKGIPGNEREVRQVMKSYIEPFADEVTTDRLGSLIAKKTGAENGPKIMIAGHLDEVGFMVTQITDKGFIRFQTVGGWWSQVMLAQRVTIVTKKERSQVLSDLSHRTFYLLKREKNRSISKRCSLILGLQAVRKHWNGAYSQVI